MPRPSLRNRLQNASQIGSSLGLVWQASKRWSTVNLLLIFCKAAVPVGLLYLMKLIIDGISQAVTMDNPTHSFDEIALLIILAGLCHYAGRVFRYFGGYATKVQSISVRDHIHLLIHTKSVQSDLEYFENPTYRDTLHRAHREGPYRPQRIVNNILQATQSLTGLVTMIGLLAFFHWSTFFLLILAACPLVLVRLVYANKEEQLSRYQEPVQRKGAYLHWIMTSVECAKEIRVFDAGKYFTELFGKTQESLRSAQIKLARGRAVAESLASLLSVVILLLFFGFLVQQALAKTISLGDTVMFYQGFQRGLNSMQTLMRNIANLYEDNLYVTHLFAFLGKENSITDPVFPVSPSQPESATIEMKSLSFRYPNNDRDTLQDVSLHVGPGETVALVGVNGAGKSTLVKLLCRLYDPNSGFIQLNGRDYRDWRVADLRRNISCVFQDFVQYHLSVVENIALMTPVDHDQRLSMAAEKSGADTFIDNLPQGMNTILGPRFTSGRELSRGEWQKIALARAFFRKAQFIILDEPASSLDPLAEHALFHHFKSLIENRSALIISHRLATVRMADRIYLLSQGRIEEQGTHEELLARGNQYAEMYELQQSLSTGKH